jgi:hypothetical protein
MAPAREKKTYWSLDDAGCLAVILRAYQEEGQIGMTVRHFYYKLLSAGAIRLLEGRNNSAKNAYNYVSRLLTDARLNAQLPWGAVVDPGRRAFTHWGYKSIAQYIRTESHSSFRADIWLGQPRRLEVWVEKDAMAEFVNAVARQYRVPVYVAKGYGSATVIHDAAERYGSGRGWTLLYAGDFDPSGLDIERNLYATLRAHGARPQIHRVALQQEDTLRLPSVAALALKEKDSRTKQFVADYGEDQKGYELDAMPGGQLRQKLHDALALYLDLDELDRMLELERAVRREAEAVLGAALEELGTRMLRDGLPGTTVTVQTVRRYLLADESEEA